VLVRISEHKEYEYSSIWERVPNLFDLVHWCDEKWLELRRMSRNANQTETEVEAKCVLEERDDISGGGKDGKESLSDTCSVKVVLYVH
jgi:hypothetical protein